MSAPETLPQPLKIPEVSRFIHRANQLRSIKPAVAYWCDYRAVNQIVTRSLHVADDDCFTFTKSLIERLETTKTERADDDAIVDNTAGQAYVEQFAQETFSRAERAMSANKVTRQTADTFDAAATFFDLFHEWGTPEPEIIKKIKFAKWNAARILRAIREGKDPNESNPVIEEEPEVHLDPHDASVQQLASPPASTLAASVEDIPDLGEPSAVSPNDSFFPPVPQDSASPLGPTSSSQSFDIKGLSQLPPAQISPVVSPSARVDPLQSISQTSANFAAEETPTYIESVRPSAMNYTTTPTAGPPSLPGLVSQAPVPTRHDFSTGTNGLHADFVPDLKQAQKHARFAVSALDFDDVEAAIEQLRQALKNLGAK